MNSAGSAAAAARAWFSALEPDQRAQALAVREDPAFVGMFLQMFAMEVHNISSGAHALFAKEYLARCYVEAKMHTRRKHRGAAKPAVAEGMEGQMPNPNGNGATEQPEGDQFALAARLFRHVIVGVGAQGCEYLSVSEGAVAYPMEFLGVLNVLCGDRFFAHPPTPADIRAASNSRTFLECNWLNIRFPQPLHVVLVSRLQLAFWTHFYDSLQGPSATTTVLRPSLSTGQPDIMKLCTFWESLSLPQQHTILEGNAPALAFHAESETQPEIMIRRLVQCPLRWVCSDCGTAAALSVERLLEQFADSIAEELGTDEQESSIIPSTAARNGHKPKRRKKSRSKQANKALHNNTNETNTMCSFDGGVTLPNGEHHPGSPVTVSISNEHACSAAPMSPRDVSHEVDSYSTASLHRSLDEIDDNAEDDDGNERNLQREMAAKAMEDERVARMSYIHQVQTENDIERRRQAQIADNAAEEERRRRIEEIAEADRQSEKERQDAQRRVRAATEQERARQLLQLELHRDMEQKERRRRQNWAVKQLNEQQIRARVQHEHHMRRVQDTLAKNVLIFTKRMELFRSLHRNVCEAIRASLEDLVNSIWPGSSVMVFGSCAMGLTLPSSDIDLVIQLPEGAQVPGQPPRPADAPEDLPSFDVTAAIHTLASCLMTVPWLSSLCPIDSAAVPVIKCTATAHALNIPASQGTSLSFFSDIRHIPVDITFDTGSHSGLSTCDYVQRVLAETQDELLGLVLVIKELLAQYGLNTPYSGGLSSYGVILLAKASIEVWRRSPPPPRLRGRSSSTATDSGSMEHTSSDDASNDPFAPERPNVGQLLVQFLSLYGRNFNPLTHGVDVTREDSPIFPITQPQQAFHVVVVDPLDPTRNVAKAAFAFRQVQWVFSQCLATLDTAGCALCYRHPNAEVLKLLIRY